MNICRRRDPTYIVPQVCLGQLDPRRRYDAIETPANEVTNAAVAVFALPVRETRGMTMVKGYSVE